MTTAHGSPTAVIFGGSGFVGTRLAKTLVKDNYRVIIADIVPPKTRAAGVSFASCDVRRAIDLHSHDLPDVVFNLAAVHRTPGHRDDEYYDTNVAGALNVTEWCTRKGIRAVCFASSISVYGPVESPTDEGEELAPNGAYGKSKLLAEKIHEGWSGQNRRLVIVRPAVVFGPGENGNFTRLAASLRSGLFIFPGRSDTIKASIYVDDLVDAMLHLLELEQTKSIANCAFPQPYTIGEICDAFSEVAGYRRPRRLPGRLTAAARAVLIRGGPRGRILSARVDKLTSSTNIVPNVLVESRFAWRHDIKSALQTWQAESPSGRFI